MHDKSHSKDFADALENENAGKDVINVLKLRVDLGEVRGSVDTIVIVRHREHHRVAKDNRRDKPIKPLPLNEPHYGLTDRVVCFK